MSTAKIGRESAPERLENATLGRQVTDLVRRDILFGRLKPGTKIAQQQLCDRFGISRMPVRDALRQLMQEGLLIPDGARHCVVARLGRRDIEDSYLIEGMLHGLAVRRVTESHDPAQLAELWERHEAMCGCGDDVQTFATRNYAFHRRINMMADSRKLNAALRVLALSIPNDFVSQFPQWVDRANAEHTDILTAMKSRKADRAESLTREHVAEAGRDLIRYLESQGVALD